MPITPYHLVLNYVVYLVLVQFKAIKKGNYAPLWWMFGSNIIDIDHLFRIFFNKPIDMQVYGLDNLVLHGWWNVLLIGIIAMVKKYRWFALGWACHIILDGLMIVFGFNSFLFRPK